MILKKVIDKKEIVDNMDKAKKIIEKSIKTFIDDCKNNNNIWGQIRLIFSNHQEIYNIDDDYFENDNYETENNPFIVLMKEITGEDLYCSIYTRFSSEDLDSIDEYFSIKCGISSIDLNTYIEGTYENDELKFEEKEITSVSGIRGEPYEVTNQINYNQGYKYSDILIKRFIEISGKDIVQNTVPIPIEIDDWGLCSMFVIDANSVNKKAKDFKCKNDYIVYIKESGEVFFTTAVSKKYDCSNKDYIDNCIEQAENSKFQNCFVKRMWFEGDFVFACYSDLSIINTIKFEINAAIKEDMTNFYNYNIFNLIKFLEKFADYIANDFDR